MVGIFKNDVVKIDLSGSIGSEQGKVRYGVVVQNNKGNLFSSCTIVMPLTSKIKSLHQPTHTLIRSNVNTGLKTDSMLLGEQMRAISS